MPAAPLLHDLERLVDRDRGAALQDRASLRETHRGVERIGLQDGVAARRGRSIADRAVARDLLAGLGEWVPAVGERRADLVEPGIPGLHDGGLLGFRLGHAATAVEQEVL